MVLAASVDHGRRQACRNGCRNSGSATRTQKRSAVNHHHIDLIDTTEMFLRTIWELEEEGVTPLRARIAERLGQSGPTVSQTVARMERDGLVHVESDRHLALTETGRRRAVSVMRKHRLAERLLSDVIGLEWEQLHIEACRWEHVMSEAVERRILTLLDEPLVCPHGNPDSRPGRTRPAAEVEPTAGRPGRRPGRSARRPTAHPGRLGRRRRGDGPDRADQRAAAARRRGDAPAQRLRPDSWRVGGDQPQAGRAARRRCRQREPVREEIAEHIFVSVPA